MAGELDDVSGAELIDTVVARLTGEAPPREVRLDFRDLVRIDPLGLSALLMIHRHTSAARVALRLDNRPVVLDRILHQTNVLEHLTAAFTADGAREDPGDTAGPPAP
ncbi:STAS domain-containing protein [Streptomyces sp. Tu 3180]|uniref:STAS domain-containing protein n=1 Tax=Streptomyces sp. Tu 3180 TaxID=2682611 RepID=UPI001AA0A450|nr:STAS domain-containing protein [Streptomyces sp. Tu 3180]